MTAHTHGPFAFDGMGRRTCVGCGAPVRSQPAAQPNAVPWRRYWAVVVPLCIAVACVLVLFVRGQS